MAYFKLQLEDFSTTEYELIAIHTTLEVSKLAYLLNKTLSTRFHYFDNIDKKEKKKRVLLKDIYLMMKKMKSIGICFTISQL